MILELAASRKPPVISSFLVAYFAHDSDIKDGAFLQYAQPYQAPEPLHCTGNMYRLVLAALQRPLNPYHYHVSFFRHDVPMPFGIKPGILWPGTFATIYPRSKYLSRGTSVARCTRS
jgi:hypothetical protein